MERHNRLHTTASVTLAGAFATLLALPALSGAGLLEDVQRGVQRAAQPVQQAVQQVLPPAQRSRPAAPVAPAQTPGQGAYQPPAHGANPHGQGSIAVVDLSPSEQRPLAGDPTGAADQGADREEVIVGRARGEQGADGNYRGHITIVSLFGNEVLGVDTAEGQTATGPLDALQTGVLDALCAGSTGNLCLEVLRADSATTDTGSTNSFAVARASVGGASGLNVTAAESNGNISQDASCQTSHGDTTVANVNAGGSAVANAVSSSTESRACSDGAQAQQNGSQVIGLGGTAVPLPAAGCGDGSPDTAFTPLAPLASVACNADDTSGAGEALAQAGAPYGVREALAVFALEFGGTSLVKTGAGASESRAQAPAGPGGPGGPGETECSDGVDNDGDGRIDLDDPDCDSPQDDSEAGPGRPREERPDRGDDTEDRRDGAGRPECSDGIDNDGDGEIDFPNDPQCDSPDDDSESGDAGATTRGPDERLPVTGADLLLLALLGALALAGGLTLRRSAERWRVGA